LYTISRLNESPPAAILCAPEAFPSDSAPAIPVWQFVVFSVILVSARGYRAIFKEGTHMLNWDALESTCLNCTGCRLHETRHNVVFGSGSREAEVLFIGEGPGEQEDLSGMPFVGRAGRLLDDMLGCIGLARERVYIANIIKCRPPNNRDPLTTEQEACIGYLRNQVYLLRPKLIVCLGRIAASRIIKEDFKITAEHGQWFERGKYRMMGLYHPAFLLRDPNRRPEAFEDLKKLEAAIRETCMRTPLD